MEYIIEMLNITKEFPGIVANDNVTLQLKKGEIHALLGENGAGKSTLMSVLFGLYKPEKGEIIKNGAVVDIRSPNDANSLGIGMVHQHFKLVENFTVTENIMLGIEPIKKGFLNKNQARNKIKELSERYGLSVDIDALIEDISVGMQQRVEILKMLYRDNEILIFDEPTAVLTPQEIKEFIAIMKGLANEGKSILFITHKLNEIMSVADRCSVLRKGKYIGTVDIKNTTKNQLSRMMVGREISFEMEKSKSTLGQTVLSVENITVPSKTHKNNAVKNVSFDIKSGEIVCLVGIEGNGQSELVYALTGLEKLGITPYDNNHKKHSGINMFNSRLMRKNSVVRGKITLAGRDITKATIRKRSLIGMSHIPEDRHKFGLVLDYTLSQNLVLQRYYDKKFQKFGFIRQASIKKYAERLINDYDIRSGQGASTIMRSMSGGNQQKAIIAREIDKDPQLLIAVQPTRGLDVGAIEFIHKQLIAERDAGKAVFLVSFELEEVMNVADRILVIYEGEIVAELDPDKTTIEELGLYMAGVKGT